MAGQTARCPHCQGLLTLPASPINVEPVILTPLPPGPDAYRSDRDDDLARPSRRSRRREYDEDDRGRGGFRCPFCKTSSPPYVRSKISTAGWVLFVVLLLGCFPVCWVGLLITENYRVCDECGITLG